MSFDTKNVGKSVFDKEIVFWFVLKIQTPKTLEMLFLFLFPIK